MHNNIKTCLDTSTLVFMALTVQDISTSIIQSKRIVASISMSFSESFSAVLADDVDEIECRSKITAFSIEEKLMSVKLELTPSRLRP